MLLDVDGMKCGGCVRSVERTLLDQPGVCEASVNLVTRSAWLRFEEDAVADLAGVVEALTARGFSAHPRETTRSVHRLRQIAAGVGGSSGVS